MARSVLKLPHIEHDVRVGREAARPTGPQRLNRARCRNENARLQQLIPIRDPTAAE